MKKGLKFTKSQLEELYVGKKLSLNQIGEKFGCNGTNILYWLKKFDIGRRPAYRRKVDIPKSVLEDLYWNKNLKTQEIAELYGIKRGGTILKKMKKLGIPSKTVSQASTIKFKRSFDGDLEEKAYFLGLRAGDFHAKRIKNCVRVQTTTTHQAQKDLLRNSFKKYGEFRKYLSKNEAREDEWFIYVDLNSSFDFLLNKPEKIPDWILEDDVLFYHFFSAYIDCEGNCHLSRTHEVHSRFSLRLRVSDKVILENIKTKLEMLNYNPLYYLDRRKGQYAPYGRYNNDIYNLTLGRKNEVISIIKKILKISRHTEKIRKMKIMLENKDCPYSKIIIKWLKLKQEIKNELLKNQLNK